MMGTVVFSLRNWAAGDELDLGYRAAYSALSKPAWGLALSWIIVVSMLGGKSPLEYQVAH